MLGGCEPLFKPGYLPEGYTYNKDVDDYEAHRDSPLGSIFAGIGDTLQGTPERAEEYKRKKIERERMAKAEEHFPELSDETAWQEFSPAASEAGTNDNIEIYSLDRYETVPIDSPYNQGPAYTISSDAYDHTYWKEASARLLTDLAASFGVPSSGVYIIPGSGGPDFESAMREEMNAGGWSIADNAEEALFSLRLDRQGADGQLRLGAALMSGSVVIDEASGFFSPGTINTSQAPLPDYRRSAASSTEPVALTP